MVQPDRQQTFERMIQFIVVNSAGADPFGCSADEIREAFPGVPAVVIDKARVEASMRVERATREAVEAWFAGGDVVDPPPRTRREFEPRPTMGGESRHAMSGAYGDLDDLPF